MAERVNILLIEDNPGDRQLIMQEFRQFEQEFHFVVKEDGELALNYLESYSADNEDLPHLIILDLNLPRVSGIEVLAEYKKHEIFSTIPVIVFSSSTSAGDIQKAYKNYANCYIAKPFSYDEFSEAILNIWRFWFHTSKLPVGK